eukprot:TRINITY_DN12380_c0_g1_i2.p1 TRINITY_DN12380_c0_g1~~TRINITY_DN12380_c0_g1_i2.p1  ORF type:complete len:291 (-),score=62.96 TRINITY_DN12380_c0_g1_i2:9-881(-)
MMIINRVKRLKSRRTTLGKRTNTIRGRFYANSNGYKQDTSIKSRKTTDAETDAVMADKAVWEKMTLWGLTRATDTISASSGLLNKGITFTKDLGVSAINSSADKLKDIIPEKERQTQVPKVVSDAVNLTSTTTKGSAKLVKGGIDTILNIGKSTGKTAASLLKDAIGEQEINKTDGDISKATKKLFSTGASSVIDIVDNIDKSASEVTNAATDSVVGISKHRYGEEVGDIVQESINIGTDVVVTTKKIKTFGVKKLAKKTAKEVGISATKELFDKENCKRGWYISNKRIV